MSTRSASLQSRKTENGQDSPLTKLVRFNPYASIRNR